MHFTLVFEMLDSMQDASQYIRVFQVYKFQSGNCFEAFLKISSVF